MISACPHCARLIGSDEGLYRLHGAWFPVACRHHWMYRGDTEVVKNHAWWYNSVIDGGRRGLLMGPWGTYEEAELHAQEAMMRALGSGQPELDFAGYGIASSNAIRQTVFGRGLAQAARILPTWA